MLMCSVTFSTARSTKTQRTAWSIVPKITGTDMIFWLLSFQVNRPKLENLSIWVHFLSTFWRYKNVYKQGLLPMYTTINLILCLDSRLWYLLNVLNILYCDSQPTLHQQMRSRRSVYAPAADDSEGEHRIDSSFKEQHHTIIILDISILNPQLSY